MPDKLEELANTLGDHIKKLESLKIEEPTLKQIQNDADRFFEGLDHTERQRRAYIESLMAAKIVELELDIEGLKKQIRS